MPQPETVAGYFRVSHARDDMRAPELYRDQIERYCAYKHLQLAEIFSDIDYSAFRGAKARPALEQLKARRFEFGGVVVPKLARFGRSVRDLVRTNSGPDHPRRSLRRLSCRGSRSRCPACRPRRSASR